MCKLLPSAVQTSLHTLVLPSILRVSLLDFLRSTFVLAPDLTSVLLVSLLVSLFFPLKWLMAVSILLLKWYPPPSSLPHGVCGPWSSLVLTACYLHGDGWLRRCHGLLLTTAEGRAHTWDASPIPSLSLSLCFSFFISTFVFHPSVFYNFSGQCWAAARCFTPLWMLILWRDSWWQGQTVRLEFGLFLVTFSCSSSIPPLFAPCCPTSWGRRQMVC